MKFIVQDKDGSGLITGLLQFIEVFYPSLCLFLAQAGLTTVNISGLKHFTSLQNIVF